MPNIEHIAEQLENIQYCIDCFSRDAEKIADYPYAGLNQNISNLSEMYKQLDKFLIVLKQKEDPANPCVGLYNFINAQKMRVSGLCFYLNNVVKDRIQRN